MKLVTYLGPSDRRRIRVGNRELYLDEGVPVEVSNETAAVAQRMCGPRVAVSDIEVTADKSEGDRPPNEGESNGS